MTEVADVTEIRGCCDGTDVAEVADVTEIRGTMAPKPYPVSKQERQYLELENWCDSTDKREIFPISTFGWDVFHVNRPLWSARHCLYKKGCEEKF